MEWLSQQPLLRWFDFYLVFAFGLSTVLRLQQYRTLAQVIRAVPTRWPRLFELIKQHHHLFLTWATLRPLVLTLGLWLLNSLLRYLLLPSDTDLTVHLLFQHWLAVPIVVLTGVAMLWWDTRGALMVTDIDRNELEKYFDQAEFWLRSWTGPVVRVVTLGFINPRQMVTKEVRAALENASLTVNSTLWWMSIQTALRIAYGLSLWLTYAWTRFAGGS